MSKDLLSTKTEHQRKRIYDHLQEKKRASTITLRRDLDILAPAPRILELRRQGINIITHWTVEFTPKGKHRVAVYVLLPGKDNNE